MWSAALVTSSFPAIHAVTDSASVLNEGFVARAEQVMTALGPRGAVHLRSSRITGRHFHEIAGILASFQAATGCWLIVNDRVDIARAVGARGAQLASHSLQVREARMVAPDVPLGASVHSVEEGIEAEASGAAWCVAGTIFETPSHEGRTPARVDFVKRLAEAVRIPIITIGGIAPENVAELLAAGAYGVATIRGVRWDAKPRESSDDDDLLKTRLPIERDVGFMEPVTRYISAYDSASGVEQNDHVDRERGIPGAGAA
jgi:thiazole tautomerase (transcriptional regulator TenI)